MASDPIYYYRNKTSDDLTSYSDSLGREILDITDIGWTYSGHSFVNWNTKRDGSGTSYEPGNLPGEPLVSQNLYAVWAEDVNITFEYKGNQIGAMTDSGTKTLETAGKYCEDDITITYVKPTTALQDKNVSIQSNGMYIAVPDSEYDGLSKVTINTSVPTGTDTSDATATASEILSGYTAYTASGKVTGTHVDLDTSDATATAADIRSGKTAYVNGSKVTGSIANYTGSTSVTADTATLSTSGKYMTSNITVNNTNSTKMLNGTITSVTNSTVTSLRRYALYGCTSLTSVSFPNVTSIVNSALSGCTNLTSVDMPKLKTIAGSGFNGCTKLTSVEFPAVTSIGNNAFAGCTRLTSLTLSNTSQVATLGTSAIPSNTTVYVPASLLNSYKSATNWSSIASQIQAIS